MSEELIKWFIPENKIFGRANIDLARIFVFTHLFGPLIAQPMIVILYFISPEVNYSLIVMMIGIAFFWTLPFVLRFTGNMTLSTLMSFQGLTTISLFGTYQYGGFSSPFLPWLIVSLLLGFFYLSKHVTMVLGLFGATLAVFLTAFLINGFPENVPIESLKLVGWMSIIAAATYMSWMAIYYSRMIAMHSELEVESERYRSASADLEKAREFAELQNEKRSRFFSKMSHELRTPLNAIIGYSEMLLEDCRDDETKNEQRLKDVGRIHSAGKHLFQLVGEVLDVDKFDENKSKMTITNFTLAELSEELIASAEPLVGKNGNRLVLEIPAPHDVVRSDRQKILQVLINLISNAAKFTENGVVTLKMNIDRGPGDHRLQASVQDTGIGIDAEALPRLFDTYSQADDSISNRFGGTGLGLSICQKFAVLLGGDISVSSIKGKGSKFWIDVPASLKEKETVNDETPEAAENDLKAAPAMA